MEWPGEYRWLQDFWEVVVSACDGRKWRVYARSDVLAPDGSALFLLGQRLSARGDRVEWHYVDVHGTEPPVDLEVMRQRDLIIVGRSSAFHGSRISTYVHSLDANLQARFLDERNGRRGRLIRYGDRVLACHQLEVPPLAGRCDVDYAILNYAEADVGFERRRLVGINGVTAVGTWALTRILTDDVRRQRLVEQVRTLAPASRGLHPENGFEICVRIDVGGEERLRDILNHETFRFQVEAVLVDGDKLRLREEQLQISMFPGLSKNGGKVIVGEKQVTLNELRYMIVAVLNDAGKPVSNRALCRRLGLLRGDERKEDAERIQGRVARAVHDLKKLFPGHVLGGREGYRLVGVRIVVKR